MDGTTTAAREPLAVTTTPEHIAAMPDALDPEVGARPTALLPFSHLLRISAYWLGLTVIDSAVGQFNANRLEFDGFVAKDHVGTALFLIGLGVAIVSIIVQPTVGYISDYWISRWGRRKPFIVVGSLFDVVFLAGIATANDVVALAAFVILLQLSTNTARGPFQGYVPDLVAESQVGTASGFVGLMQIIGNVTGFGLVAIAVGFHSMPVALVAVAAIELVTMASVVLRVGKGLPPKPRHGRSWAAIARGAWATDILQERSYVWMLISRLLFMGGGALLANFVLIFLGRALGMPQDDANRTQLIVMVGVVLASLVAVIPASRLSDRIGRKPVIWLGCGIGGAGIAIAAVAPSVPVAFVGGALFGASAGAFLAVDWALMTDIIPRASAGRYMGLSNVATASATTLGLAVGGVVLDVATRAGYYELSPRLVFALGVVFYGLAAVTLRPVVEPGRGAAPTAPVANPA